MLDSGQEEGTEDEYNRYDNAIMKCEVSREDEIIN